MVLTSCCGVGWISNANSEVAAKLHVIAGEMIIMFWGLAPGTQRRTPSSLNPGLNMSDSSATTEPPPH